MELKCPNSKCLHEWNYKGKAIRDKDLVTCSKCYYRNALKKLKKEQITHKSLTTHSLTHSEKDYVIQENKEGDKLMIFNDGLKVLIPRGEILLPMLEKWGKRNV